MIDLATTTNVNGYVRAVLYAAEDGSLIGTQPMRIQQEQHVRDASELYTWT